MSSRRREKDQRKQERARSQQSLEGLRDQFGPSILGGSAVESEALPSESMSKVLNAFVSPYLGFTATDNDRRRLYAVAIVAWNAALLPLDRRDDLLDSAFARFLPDGSPSEIDDLRLVIEQMIVRRTTYFASDMRFIESFTLQTTDEGYDLSVVSSLAGLPS